MRLFIFIIIVLLSMTNCKTTVYKNKSFSHDVINTLFAENREIGELTDLYLSSNAFQNWIIQLKEKADYKGPFFSEEFTDYTKHPNNIFIDTLDIESRMLLNDNIKNKISLYMLNFGEALKYDTNGYYTVCFSENVVRQAGIETCLYGSKHNKPVELKNEYLIILTENQKDSRIYYLSEWFFSYESSIQKLWHNFFNYNIIHHSEYKEWEPENLSYKETEKSNRSLYLHLGLQKDSLYHNYFRLILESDYRPESFQLVKQKKDEVIFRFYSKEDEQYYKLRFEAIRPYNFKIRKDG